MSPNAIEIRGASKRYLLGEHHGRRPSLRESVSGGLARLGRRRGGADRPTEIWSLRDVTIDVAEGTAVGLIGRNGAGKSTLLKLVTRITEPTLGVARTRGRVGSLLEVGTGFHPELTGRENVFLNGAILGMGRRATARSFDEIVEFAGVERFIDTPVKRYSSGMYLRLAFAVAAHLDVEIMVVDEVLAVGDAEFQRKCLNKMSSLEHDGRTVMFVSHNLDAIERLCTSAVWIDQGRVVDSGASKEVIGRYLTAGLAEAAERSFPASADDLASLRSVRILGGGDAPASVLRQEDPIVIEARLSLRSRVPTIDLAVSLTTVRGVRVVDEAWSDRAPADRGDPGEYVVRVSIPPVLGVGEYQASFWLGSAYETFAFHEEALRFRLEGRTMGRPNRVVHLHPDWEVGRIGARHVEATEP